MREFPWHDWNEWEIVYDSFFKNIVRKKDLTLELFINNLLSTEKASICSGLATIESWLIRSSKHTPILVNSTLNILRCLSDFFNSDEKNDKESEQGKKKGKLKLEKAILTIIRTINNIGDKERIFRSKSVSFICKNIGIGEEIVSIRHECTHRRLSSPYQIHMGLFHLLFWIYNKYWKPQKNRIIHANQSYQLFHHFILHFGVQSEQHKHNDNNNNNNLQKELMKPNPNQRIPVARLILKKIIRHNKIVILKQDLHKLLSLFLKEFMNSIQVKLHSQNIKQREYEFLKGKQCCWKDIKKCAQIKINRYVVFFSFYYYFQNKYQKPFVKSLFHELIQIFSKLVLNNMEDSNHNYQEELKILVILNFLIKNSQFKMKSIFKDASFWENSFMRISVFQRINLLVDLFVRALKIPKLPSQLQSKNDFKSFDFSSVLYKPSDSTQIKRPNLTKNELSNLLFTSYQYEKPIKKNLELVEISQDFLENWVHIMFRDSNIIALS